MKKIALFGSAFNPPSLGHASVLQSLTHFDLVLVEPSIAHAWGKNMLDYETRCRLVDAFLEDLQLSYVKRTNFEQDLFQPGKSVTTYELLKKIQEVYPEADISFVIGPDNMFKFSSFYKAEELLERWSVMVYPERVKIRSTDIRNAITDGNSVSNLTTPSVEAIITGESLYSK